VVRRIELLSGNYGVLTVDGSLSTVNPNDFNTFGRGSMYHPDEQKVYFLTGGLIRTLTFAGSTSTLMRVPLNYPSTTFTFSFGFAPEEYNYLLPSSASFSDVIYGGVSGTSGDVDGPLTQARFLFNAESSITYNPLTSDIYVWDQGIGGNGRIRKITPSGTVSTLPIVTLTNYQQIVCSPFSNVLYCGSVIDGYISTINLTTYAKTSNYVGIFALSMTIDPSYSNLYLFPYTGGSILYKIPTSNLNISTAITITGGFSGYPRGLAINSTGTVLYVGAKQAVYSIIIATGVSTKIAGRGSTLGAFTADGPIGSNVGIDPAFICINTANTFLYFTDLITLVVRRIELLSGNYGVLTVDGSLSTVNPNPLNSIGRGSMYHPDQDKIYFLTEGLIRTLTYTGLTSAVAEVPLNSPFNTLVNYKLSGSNTTLIQNTTGRQVTVAVGRGVVNGRVSNSNLNSIPGSSDVKTLYITGLTTYSLY